MTMNSTHGNSTPSSQTPPPDHIPTHPQRGATVQPGRQGRDAPAQKGSLNWLLILGLGLLALARPITNTVLDQLGIELGPVVPLGSTLLISVIWIGSVGLTRTLSPVLTLLLTGLTYGVAAIALSGILSPILLGELQGPLTTPIGIVAVLVTNAIWGLIAGAIALVLQRARGIRTGSTPVRA